MTTAELFQNATLLYRHGEQTSRLILAVEGGQRIYVTRVTVTDGLVCSEAALNHAVTGCAGRPGIRQMRPPGRKLRSPLTLSDAAARSPAMPQ